MNKKFFTVLLSVVFTTSYVQAQFSFGARTGYNLSKLSEKYENPPEEDFSKFKPGFQIGAVGEYAVSNAFAIQSGVLFTTKGALYKGSDWKTTKNINYIQIPVNALYKKDLGGTILLLQAGLYRSFAISGKRKWDYSSSNIIMLPPTPEKGESKITFGNCNCQGAEMRPLDFGIGMGAGLQFRNFQFGIEYNLGIANLSTSPKEWNHSLKNNGFAFTLAYLFGKRMQKTNTD